MNNSHYILKKSLNGTIILTVLTGLQFVFTLLTQVVLARSLLPDDFGIAAFCVAVSFFFVTASSLSGDKFYLSEKAEPDLNKIISTEIVIAVFIFVLANLCLPYVMALIDKQDHLIYCQVLLLLCFYNPLSRPRALLEKQLEFYHSKKFFFLAQFLACIIAMVTVYFDGGVWAIIFWRFSALFLEVVFLNFFLSFRFKLTFPNSTFLKRFSKFGLPMTIASVAVYFYGNVDYYIISTFLDPVELGYYWLAYQFTNQILQGRKIVVSVAIPSFVSLTCKETMQSSFEIVTKTLIWIYSIPFFAFYVFEDDLVTLLFGSNWVSATDLFIVFSVVILLRAITTLLEPICVKYQKTKAFMNITLISSVLMVGMGVALIQIFGLKGMSIAVLITTIITVVISLSVIFSVLPVSVFKSIIHPLLFVIVFSVASKYILIFLNEVFHSSYLVNSFLVCILYLVLFAILENKMLRNGWGGVSNLLNKRFLNE